MVDKLLQISAMLALGFMAGALFEDYKLITKPYVNCIEQKIVPTICLKIVGP